LALRSLSEEAALAAWKSSLRGLVGWYAPPDQSGQAGRMATEYVAKHKLSGTIEKALAEALAPQPENPYEALAAWFESKAGAPASSEDKDFGTGEKKAGEANGYGARAAEQTHATRARVGCARCPAAAAAGAAPTASHSSRRQQLLMPPLVHCLSLAGCSPRRRGG
jgi:hypothetical protein